ncbi:MAG: SDR family NAD(P)-dependent oxidoreductase [Acidobacteriia bacterium]|nr:SDR family NAD(P)-dependent oxidoreductase [Terriglobia bacterium]
MTNSALHPDLSGRVAVITGASRGIGKALALRLAREGADIVVAAKSERSTERLPGSIHETADAIRALGRRALPVAADVW